MNIIMIGDIVGRPGRRAIRELLPNLRKEYAADLVVANGENAASGAGLTVETYHELLESGIDFLTSGDHIWAKPVIYPILETKNEKLIRPANYPLRDPGRGFDDILVGNQRVRIINLQGNVFMNKSLDSPFEVADEILEDSHKPEIILVDFHAEATSEKVALSHYLDGRVSAVVGSHTHVQTNDNRIMAGGTAALTDLGMTGPRDGVIGVTKEVIIDSYITAMPWSYEVAPGAIILSGLFVEVDKNGKAIRTELIRREIEA